VPGDPQNIIRPENSNAPAAKVGDLLAAYAPLYDRGQVQIRQHRDIMYTSIYYADEQFLVGQHAYGIPAGRAPVLHLRRVDGRDMVAAYLDAFEQAWSDAQTAD
jgi:hypothetical protein